MSFPRIILKQKLCLALFAGGIVISILLELAGVGALSTEPLIKTGITLPVSDYIILPVVYAAAAVIAGLMTKRRGNAPIYGACLGQCQLLLPVIILFVLHRGGAADAIWRSLCGLPLTACIAGAAYSIKQLAVSSLKRKDS